MVSVEGQQKREREGEREKREERQNRGKGPVSAYLEEVERNAEIHLYVVEAKQWC